MQRPEAGTGIGLEHCVAVAANNKAPVKERKERKTEFMDAPEKKD
jgi:hypothetical protein